MTISDAENRGPVGPRARAGQARLLTSHVPIRFRAQTIEKAKAIAERDGMTVSSWIRGVVEREVERRMPAFPQTHRSESGVTVRIIRRTDPTVEAETQNRYYDPDRAQLESV
jgi:antitoxin component of RelBE/YafQ-DinJ toxin-antitoxin module